MHWSEILATMVQTELKNLTIFERVFKNKLQDFIRENNSFLIQ
jgi:hypothetical protein